jgi:hypothetical protein
MARISVAVSGDVWCNKNQVLEHIAKNVGARHLVLDLNSEGPSLGALGITDAVIKASAEIGILPGKIWIDRWQNPVEHIPFKRARRPGLSHFFWLSENYSAAAADPAARRVPFGLFVGRATLERMTIMYDLYHSVPNQVILSLMKNHGSSRMVDLDFDSWSASDRNANHFREWMLDPPVGSITNHEVRDQYRPGTNTNACLIKHYDKFAVEIVCETYCAGDAFFPTEKTVRPLSKGKPLIIFGPKNFLSRLHDLGFRSWSGVWDETYDAHAGPQRWQHIKVLIQTILKQKLYLDPILIEIAQHNQENLQRLIAAHKPQ